MSGISTNTAETSPTGSVNLDLAPDGTGDLEEISTAECLDLLRSEQIGRIGVAVGERPEIFPVNYSLDASDSVVWRTAPGIKIFGAVNHHVVFEVDRFDTAQEWGWSVVVHGVARQTGRIAEGAHPLASWRSDAPNLVRIAGSSITGRRIRRHR